MNHRHLTLTGVTIAALASAPALAGQRHDPDSMDRDARGHGDRRAMIEMLEDKDGALQRKATERRIGAVERGEIAEQRDRIDDLIDDLEDGRSVAPGMIDQALGYPYHGHHRHHHHDKS